MVVQPGKLKNEFAALCQLIDRYIYGGCPIFVAEADVILIRSNAKKKRLHPELEPLYRYVCKAVPFDFITDSRPEYHMRLRIVRFQISDGIYENIITNPLPMSFHWNR